MTIEERLEQVEAEMAEVKEELAALKEGRETIRAKRFDVVDEKGRTRAVLSVGEDGSGLALYDEEGVAIWSAP